MPLSFFPFACAAKGADVPDKACAFSPRCPVLDPSSLIRRCSSLSLSTAWLLAHNVPRFGGRELGGPVRWSSIGSRNVLIAAEDRSALHQVIGSTSRSMEIWIRTWPYWRRETSEGVSPLYTKPTRQGAVYFERTRVAVAFHPPIIGRKLT